MSYLPVVIDATYMGDGPDHMKCYTFGNLKFHSFFFESLILNDLEEADFILPDAISSF
jgi:hypothetical protein